ncbi:cAMP-dependent protein kinase inhibitor beta isoform X1 [Orcinus orca]|uniref:cAMP-dependent protein kinase inhibitor beta isoform X1 n=1 Tax=Orcinus orca TaxID=9733 RepID=UPI002111B059|nr:cAMP-dependent protein kinase inhibitor beta isoform X1 [Orcinus orca]
MNTKAIYGITDVNLIKHELRARGHGILKKHSREIWGELETIKLLRPHRGQKRQRCCYEDRFIKNDGCGAYGQQFCLISKGRPPECSTRHPGFSCHGWNLGVAPQTGGPLREGR